MMMTTAVSVAEYSPMPGMRRTRFVCGMMALSTAMAMAPASNAATAARTLTPPSTRRPPSPSASASVPPSLAPSAAATSRGRAWWPTNTAAGTTPAAGSPSRRRTWSTPGGPTMAPYPRQRRHHQRRQPPWRTPHHRSPLLLPPHLQLPDFHHRVLPKQLASGVVGLDRKAQSFWGQMCTSQIIHPAQFSLCFVRQPVASFSGTHAGAVSFGGADPRLHASPMVFAKAMGHGSTASFKVRARKMYLGENGGGERGGEHDVRCDLDSE
mmetsp:Transcript_1277/g.2930  ORF Transcript_1277/g.2930 Transcript_1277/m.2930 type:complete len:267 (+) Transcript_1277:128-928(+)